jgi:Arc/MetJ-type ribon-helix-helix transcriptional regulator
MENQVIEVPRERVSITLPKECIDWIDEQVKDRKYANRSHAIEVIVLEAKKKE